MIFSGFSDEDERRDRDARDTRERDRRDLCDGDGERTDKVCDDMWSHSRTERGASARLSVSTFSVIFSARKSAGGASIRWTVVAGMLVRK